MSNVKTTDKRLIQYRVYAFSRCIISLLMQLPDKQIYWCFKDQLMRCSTSIGANVLEARSSSSRREFIKFYEIALKSANETKYWLYLLRDTKLISETNQFIQIKQEIDEIAKMLATAIMTLKKKNS